VLQWWLSPEGTHAIALPKNGMAIFDRKHEWKAATQPSSSTKTWRCLLKGWSEEDRYLLCDLARGYSTCGRKLPQVQRVALRVKGFLWTVAAPGTPNPETLTTEDRRPRRPDFTQRDNFLAWTDKMFLAPPDSELEALIVFSDNIRKKALGEMLPATWTPESYPAWEEEVLNYGLFDVVFDHTFFSRDYPFLEDKMYQVWSDLTNDDFVGSRPPLTIPETHAALLARHSNVELWHLQQLLERDAWPADMGISSSEAVTAMQNIHQMDPSLKAVRRHYAAIQSFYASVHKDEPPSIPERILLLANCCHGLKDMGIDLSGHNPLAIFEYPPPGLDPKEVLPPPVWDGKGMPPVTVPPTAKFLAEAEQADIDMVNGMFANESDDGD